MTYRCIFRIKFAGTSCFPVPTYVWQFLVVTNNGLRRYMKETVELLCYRSTQDYLHPNSLRGSMSHKYLKHFGLSYPWKCYLWHKHHAQLCRIKKKAPQVDLFPSIHLRLVIFGRNYFKHTLWKIYRFVIEGSGHPQNRCKWKNVERRPYKNFLPLSLRWRPP